jgi:DNA-binding transcriptional LysR family regulator
MNSDPRSQIKLYRLQALVAVAEFGSFGEAALQIGVSQSAISHAIAALEADLGVTLLSRGRHGACLTPVGEQIVHNARQVLDLLDDILAKANLAKGLQGGQVRISSFRSAATHILPEVLAQFRQRYPAISVSISEYDDYPDVEEDLRKGKADIGFTFGSPTAEFEMWELMRDEYIALFPPTFTHNGAKLNWEELTSYPMIMLSDADSCDQQVIAHCANYGKTLQVGYQVKQDSTIVQMVAKGLGAAIMPHLSAEPIPTGVRVYDLPVPIYRIIYVAVLANALLTPATFAFLELLRETALLPIVSVTDSKT